MLGFKLLHVGVNNASEEVAAAESAKFATLLGENVKVGNSSMFVGTLIEMMKNPGRGTNGHICIQTNYLDRAIYHLENVVLYLTNLLSNTMTKVSLLLLT